MVFKGIVLRAIPGSISSNRNGTAAKVVISHIRRPGFKSKHCLFYWTFLQLDCEIKGDKALQFFRNLGSKIIKMLTVSLYSRKECYSEEICIKMKDQRKMHEAVKVMINIELTYYTVDVTVLLLQMLDCNSSHVLRKALTITVTILHMKCFPPLSPFLTIFAASGRHRRRRRPTTFLQFCCCANSSFARPLFRGGTNQGAASSARKLKLRNGQNIKSWIVAANWFSK